MPQQWYGELIHMFYAKLIVDLSPSDGKFLTAALSNRVGYIGVCFTEAHCEALMARARIAVIDLMKDPSSKLYSPSFAKSYMAATGEKIQEEKNKKTSGQASGVPRKGRAAKAKTADPAVGSADPNPGPVPGTPVAGEDDADSANAAMRDPDAEE